jgi:catechol 2,3-dioxygenase-like lactoylglutathione lyase family enzyme
MATVSVRYIVHDVQAAIGFYTTHLGFSVQIHPNDMFAMLSRGDLRLVLSVPGAAGGGGQAMPDGTLPEPGGWNRFSVEVPDLAVTVAELRRHGVRFRNDVVTGVGGQQIIAEDPSGNPVELFEPALPEARLSPAPVPD